MTREEWIARQLADAPPVSEAQRARLVRLLSRPAEFNTGRTTRGEG